MGTLASELTPLIPNVARPRVYADANVPVGIVNRMRRDLGWDVLFVLEHEEIRRAKDRDHFIKALELGRTIVTLDRDFCDDRAFPPDLSPGVIVCSAADESTLGRLLAYVDREFFRKPGAPDPPLRGRKVLLAVDALAAESSRESPRRTAHR